MHTAKGFKFLIGRKERMRLIVDNPNFNRIVNVGDVAVGTRLDFRGLAPAAFQLRNLQAQINPVQAEIRHRISIAVIFLHNGRGRFNSGLLSFIGAAGIIVRRPAENQKTYDDQQNADNSNQSAVAAFWSRC